MPAKADRGEQPDRPSGVRIASDASIKAALEPMKLLQSICKGGRDVSSRFDVQPLCLD
jgi:hypothetical protein